MNYTINCFNLYLYVINSSPQLRTAVKFLSEGCTHTRTHICTYICPKVTDSLTLECIGTTAYQGTHLSIVNDIKLI